MNATQQAGLPKRHERCSEHNADKSSPLSACALAVAETRMDVDNALRLVGAIDAVVCERPRGDNGEPVFSASDASTIEHIANTIEQRLFAVKDALEKQFDALHGLADAEQPAGKSGESYAATGNLKVDWDERVVSVHKGQVVVASGILEEQIKRELARVTEPAAA